jgi:hypothetical protein
MQIIKYLIGNMGKPPVLVAARKIIKTYFKQRAECSQIPTEHFVTMIGKAEAKHGLGSFEVKKIKSDYADILQKNQVQKKEYDQKVRDYKCLVNLYFLKSRAVLCRDIIKTPLERTNRFYDKPDFKL